MKWVGKYIYAAIMDSLVLKKVSADNVRYAPVQTIDQYRSYLKTKW